MQTDSLRSQLTRETVGQRMITELLENLNHSGIAYAIVCALSAWLCKVWAARIGRSENSKLQEQITKLKDDLGRAQKILSGEVQKSVHVHKVQFEKEFLVYQDLMKQANRLGPDPLFPFPHPPPPLLLSKKKN